METPKKSRVIQQITRLIAMIVVGTLIILSLPNTGGAGQTAEVTVSNWSFEDGSPPTGWTVQGGAWGTNYDKATNRKIDGNSSLKIMDNSNTANYGFRSPKVPASPLAKYEVITSVFAESGTANVYLEFWDAAGVQLETPKYAGTTATGVWQSIHVDGQAPAGTATFSVMMYSGKTNVGTAYFDTVSIQKIDELPELPNRGFESADGTGFPVNWYIYSGTSGYTVSSDYAHGGAKSLKLTDSSSTSNLGVRSERMPAAEGLKYEAAGWVLNTSSAKADLYLQFWKSSPGHVSDSLLKTALVTSTGTGTWQYVQVSDTAPADTNYVTIICYTSKAYTGTSYFDDITLKQIKDTPPVSFTPLVTGHPRLFFTPAEKTVLLNKKTDSSMSKYGTKFSDLWQSIQADADRYLSENSFTYTHSSYNKSITYTLPPAMPNPEENPAGFTGTRYPYWTQMADQLKRRLETLSFAYQMTGNAAYGNKAKNYAISLAGWNSWTDPTYKCLSGNLACLDSGAILQGVTAVYDMVYDLMSGQERQTILDAMYRLGIRPMYKQLETYTDHNIHFAIAAALTSASAAALGERDFLDAYLYRGYANGMRYLDERETSGKLEGFQYTATSLDNIYLSADHVKRITGNADPFNHPFTSGKLSRLLAYFLAPSGWGLTNFSDSSYNAHLSVSATILSNHNDGLAGWYIKEAVSTAPAFIKFRYLSHNGALMTPEAIGLDKSAQFEDIGYIALRSGWGSDDVLFAFYSDNSDYGHNHYDDNNFVLNAGGEWLITDPGYYDTSSTAKRDFSTKTIGHNSMLFSGNQQTNKTGGALAGFFTSPVLDLAVGNATSSYASTANLSQWKRRTLYVKPDYFVMADNVSLTTAGTPELLLHTDTGGVFSANGAPVSVGSALPQSFVIEKPKASVAVQLLRPSATTRLYTQYAGAEKFGTYGSVKTSSPVSTETFITLMTPSVHKDGMIEAESLIANSVSGGGKPVQVIAGSYMSAIYVGSGANDYVTYSFDVPSNGSYDLQLGFVNHVYGGIVKIELDGAVLQSAKDLYGEYDLDYATFTNRTLSAGTHQLKLTVTGKNAASFGYYVPMDYLRLLPTGASISKASPKTVSTISNGMATGLVITVTGATDQLFINPTNDTTKTTASNLTISCSSTQCMLRKPTAGGYERYASVNTLISGTSLADGAQVLVDMPSASAAAMGLAGTNRLSGTVNMGAAGAVKLYAPSFVQLKVDGAIQASGYSYSPSTKLLTINSLSGGYHQIEIEW